MRYTSEYITKLKPEEIFVFGSNLKGQHGGGAAAIAHKQWGAIWGKGIGLAGQTYAIPTKHDFRKSLDIDNIRPYVDQFIHFAKAHSELTFLVTKLGTGLAGIPIKKMAPLFSDAKDVPNIILPKEFH